ncbi:unnamed protein product, partial [Parascedosporium putredinis]
SAASTGPYMVKLSNGKHSPIVFPERTDADSQSQGRIPETTLKCIRHLRSLLPTASISVEVEKPGREGLTSLAEAADVIFYSRSWAEVAGLVHMGLRRRNGPITPRSPPTGVPR